MRREDLTELHYIIPIESVRSVLRRGLLSHVAARGIVQDSIADADVQALRAAKKVRGGRPLHEYVNLYLNARNPMMFAVVQRRGSDRLAVVRVHADALDLDEAVIADGNAASDYTRFSTPEEGLKRVATDVLFAESWKHPDDQIAEWSHKRQMCAELLVPRRVAPSMILGIYVASDAVRTQFSAAHPRLDVTVNRHIFFQDERK